MAEIDELLSEFDAPPLPDRRRKPNRIDIAGQKFGRLTAIKFDHKRYGGAPYWQFQCECGQKIVSRASHVKRGEIASCGCIRKNISEGKWRRDFLRLMAAATPEDKEWASAALAPATPSPLP